tara:strand:+ start:141 stop:899 length:759 start_codon:yes stop_codon:yes gene_type:complete
MTFQSLPIVPFEQLANEIPGFTNDEQLLNDSLRTTIFVSGSSTASQGRASYILGDEGERQWLPNTLTCWLNDINIITQKYEQYDPTEKLLVSVTSINGSTWCYRMGLDSWSSSSLLSAIRQMSRPQLAERVQISLKPKGRATFISIACITHDMSSYQTVSIPETDLGRKLGYTEMLDVISYFHLAQSANQADVNEIASSSIAASKALIEASPADAEPAAIEPLSKPKRARRKTATRAKTTKTVLTVDAETSV